jgi:hypothetical protein
VNFTSAQAGAQTPQAVFYIGPRVRSRRPSDREGFRLEPNLAARPAGKRFGEAGRSRAAETALSRVSRGKAAESQRLFGSRQEGDVSQDCVVADALHRDRSPNPNSLLTGKFTGTFGKYGPPRRFWRPVGQRIQWLTTKFPKQRNRELNWSQQGIYFEEQRLLTFSRGMLFLGRLCCLARRRSVLASSFAAIGRFPIARALGESPGSCSRRSVGGRRLKPSASCPAGAAGHSRIRCGFADCGPSGRINECLPAIVPAMGEGLG